MAPNKKPSTAAEFSIIKKLAIKLKDQLSQVTHLWLTLPQT